MTGWPTQDEIAPVVDRLAGLTRDELFYVVGSMSANDAGWAALNRALARCDTAAALARRDTPSTGA